jgi:hypothetical protein
MVWIGRRSYGIYLWHWPALVLVAAKFGPLSAPARGAVLLGSVGAAALSFRFLEDPVRHSTWLAARDRRSLALGGSLVVAGLAVGIITVALPHDNAGGGVAAAPTLPGQSTLTTVGPIVTLTSPVPTTGDTTQSTTSGAPARAAVTTAPTTTPATTTPATTTPPVTTVGVELLLAAEKASLDEGAQITAVPSNATPPVSRSKGDRPQIYHDGCVLQDGTATVRSCVYGDPASAVDIALFGDSHAAQWFPALEQLSLERHWKLDVYVKSGCPTADVRIRRTYLDPECVAWRKNVAARLSETHPALLVISSTAYDPGGSDVGVPTDVAWRRGLTDTINAIRPDAGQMLIIGDTPLPAHEVPNCLAAFPRSVRRCIAQRSTAIDTSRLELEKELAAEHTAQFVSVSDWLCGSTECPVIDGNIVMYRDNNHMTATMSRFLAPLLATAVSPLVP